MPKEGDLKVYWIPQASMNVFERRVKTLGEAAILLDVLAKYDAFQYENRVKPDYCNMGGLVIFEDDEWCDWYNEDGDSFDDWIASNWKEP